MDINCKILTFLQDHDKINELCKFNCKNNCFLCCDIFKLYLKLYKQIVIKEVSTLEKSILYNKKSYLCLRLFDRIVLNK